MSTAVASRTVRRRHVGPSYLRYLPDRRGRPGHERCRAMRSQRARLEAVALNRILTCDGEPTGMVSATAPDAPGRLSWSPCGSHRLPGDVASGRDCAPGRGVGARQVPWMTL